MNNKLFPYYIEMYLFNGVDIKYLIERFAYDNYDSAFSKFKSLQFKLYNYDKNKYTHIAINLLYYDCENEDLKMINSVEVNI